MGMKATRAARKNHPMPTRKYPLVDQSGIRGTDHSEHPSKSEKGLAPKKTWPDCSEAKYPLTPPPGANVSSAGKEGVIRGRQADKSSRSK